MISCQNPLSPGPFNHCNSLVLYLFLKTAQYLKLYISSFKDKVAVWRPSLRMNLDHEYDLVISRPASTQLMEEISS